MADESPAERIDVLPLSVLTADGSRQVVEPVAVAPFHFVHKSVQDQYGIVWQGYSLTHRRSGFALAVGISLELAKELLTVIENDPGIPWRDMVDKPTTDAERNKCGAYLDRLNVIALRTVYGDKPVDLALRK
jgi:hypothetical protein